MIIKESRFAASNEYGPTVLNLFDRSTDAFFEKTASHYVMPEVLAYINTVRPENDVCYTLVNALGAGEFYSSNSNADFFDEGGLIHRPDIWTGNPTLDAGIGRAWGYGFPTFYGAHVFPHHRNQDPNKALGTVTFVCWNPRMRRVELVTRTEREKCMRHGGQAIWDKLKANEYAEVSMGARVPGDLCSIHADWKTFEKARATYNPKLHANEGVAVAEFHKRTPIRGWAKTRREYCDEMLRTPNRILEDGRKIFVHNHYPKFFDISYVFVGADKTAKTLLHIANPSSISIPSSFKLASSRVTDFGEVKTASAKAAERKEGEIRKTDIPSQFIPAAVSSISRQEKDLPEEVLNEMARHPLQRSLASASSLGIVLRPREFQRVMLIHSGQKPMADLLDRMGRVFERESNILPDCCEVGDEAAREEELVPSVLKALLPLINSRSSLHEPLATRITIRVSGSEEPVKTASGSSYLFEPLRKMGSQYSEYRRSIMHHIALAPYALCSGQDEGEAAKLASESLYELFSPLTVEYLRSAFWEETETPPKRA